PAGPEPMMTSFESTRPAPLSAVDGPPGAGTAAASAGSSTIVIENPPNGLGVSLIWLCYTFITDTPRGYPFARLPGRRVRPSATRYVNRWRAGLAGRRAPAAPCRQARGRP